MYSLIRKTAIFLFIAVFLGSCNFFGLLNGGSDGGNVEDVDIQSLTVKSYSNDFKTAMVKQTVTAVNSSEIETIVTAAESGLGNNINSTDLEQYIPIYLEEAQTGINSTSYTDDKKIALLKAISAASMIALKDKDEYLARRSIDPYAESMQKILERVSSSLVKGLSRTGVSSTRLSEAAGESIGSMVEYISDSGVRHETISPSVQRITQSAIKSMVNSGATEASAKAEAVRRITRGATKGATKVCEKIQAPEDLGTMAENISYGASSALKDVSADDTEKKSLMKEVSDGFSEGVNDSLNEGSAIDNDNLKDMVSKAAKGSARAVKDLVDETSDPTGEKKLEFLGEVSRNSTAGASKISIDKVAGAVKEELLGEAVKGTSEGAQEVDDDGVTTAELNTVIIVVEEDELGTQTELDSADYQDEIDEGVLLGQNNDPVANAGSDMEAEIGTQVRLDGSNSYDNDQSFDTLLYEWKTTQSPSLSSSEIVDSDKVIALFTPDAPGEYFISLTVTDNAGVTDTNSFKVVATKPPEDTEYNGLTAEERLEVALNHSLFGRHGKSKDELLIILTRYPEVEVITPEAMIELSWQYIQLRKFDKAMDIALQVEQNYADTKYEALAKLARAYWYIWHFPDDMSDPERGQSIAEEVKTAFDGNDEITLEAEQVVGFYHQVKEEYTLAREVFDPIRTNSSASLRTRFWAAYHYAETYRWAGEFQMAVSEFKNIRDDAAYYTEDDGTINKALMHKVANTVAHIYRWDLREYANAVTAYQWIENNSTVKAFKMYAHTDRGWMHLWDEGDHTAALARASDVRSNYSYASGDDLSVKNAIGWSWQLTGRVYLREYWDHRDVTDLNAAQSAFDKVLADYDEFPYLYRKAKVQAGVTRRAAEAYSEAITLLQEVVNNYPSDINRTPLAEALYEMGKTYKDMGRDIMDSDYQQAELYFQEALNYLEQVSESNFSWEELHGDWPMRDAPQQIAEIYSLLGQYEYSRSYYNNLFQKTDIYNDRDRAWIKAHVVNTYMEQVWRYNDQDRRDDIINLKPDIESTFEDLKTVAGPLTASGAELPDTGTPLCYGINRMVHYYRELAEIYNDRDMSSELSSVIDPTGPIHTLADYFIDGFQNKNWNPDSWMYQDVYESKAIAYHLSGDLSSAIGVYDSYFNMAATNEDVNENDENYFWMKAELGDLYEDEAVDYIRNGQTAEAMAYLDDAITAFDYVLTTVGTDPSSWSVDDNPIGECAVDKAAAMANKVTWNFSSSTTTGIQSVENAFEVCISGIYKDTDNGAYRGEALMDRAWFYDDLAHNYWHEQSTPDYANAVAYFDNAIADLDALLSDTSARSWEVGEGKYAKVEVLTSLLRIKTEDGYPGEAPILATFTDAYNGVFDVIADNYTDEDNQAWARVRAFEIFEIAGSKLPNPDEEVYHQMMGYDISTDPSVLFAEIETLLQQVLDNYRYVDDEEPAAHAQLYIGRLKEMYIGMLNTGGGTQAEIEAAKQEAIAAYDAVIAQDGNWESWMIQEATDSKSKL